MPYNCLLIGKGEIGSAINKVFGTHHNISVKDLDFAENMREDNTYDLMLVAIPYSDSFVEIIKKYQEEYRIKATIIFSTVAIGITSQIPNAVHCPIEGKHPHISCFLKQWGFIIGGYNEIAYKFFRDATVYPAVYEKPEHTEALKLLSTSYYGHMLEFVRYANNICKDVGMNFEGFHKYNQIYNQMYATITQSNRFTRPTFTPPEGNLGGHCVCNNAKILDKQYPSIFLKEIYRDKEGNDA